MIIVTHICNPSAWELRQEIFHKFKANLFGIQCENLFQKKKEKEWRKKEKKRNFLLLLVHYSMQFYCLAILEDVI